jgi:hypothetical protein
MIPKNPNPDKFVADTTIGHILRKIFLDTSVTQSQEYFIKHKYSAADFTSLVEEDIFKRIIGFLPNVKYRGKPFILSVAYNKKNDNYEIIVHNPSFSF